MIEILLEIGDWCLFICGIIVAAIAINFIIATAWRLIGWALGPQR